MKAQLAMWGNSLAVRIPQAYAKEIGGFAGRSVEMTVREGKLVVEPVDEVPVYDLADLLEGMTPEHLHGEVSTGHAVGNEFG